MEKAIRLRASNKIGIAFFILAIAQTAIAQETENSKPRTTMAGIRLAEYTEIEKTWKLVTVRYRNDSGELRLVYANNLAWSSLKDGVSVYPDGAVFAKIALKSQYDPLFPSSLEPSQARRFQFMIRDAQKFPDTRG